MPPGPADMPAAAAEHRPAHPANQLAGQTSPYLLQHQFNPVDWRPWGDAAFAEARRRDVPIFLSIGYSTCYWCHVMERESFESEAIAATMNESFVCVKVDREERPDVDDVYMAAVQAFSGHGGWPMSVFLEPAERKPFFAGTYFPAEPTHAGMASFPQILRGIASAWKDQRKDVLDQANTLAEAVRERVAAVAKHVLIDERQVAQAVGQLLRLYDRANGGFGPAPKFPQPVYLELLLAARAAAGDDDTRSAIDGALRHTLDRMALGGMFDQVGGGFHRYSTDANWLVPHFEKMLYDNAQLAQVYAEAGRLYGEPLYTRTARRTLEYALREMVAADGGGGGEGGFYSAQDAEVKHREGWNYLWSPEQVRASLPKEDAEWVNAVYGLDQGPNFRDPHHPDEPESNVLFIAEPGPLGSSASSDDRRALFERLDRLNSTLLAVRAKREQPSTDDKALAAWNGLMIGAMSRCGVILDEPRFIAAARRAADFILARMRAPDGGLFRSYARGSAQIDAFLEDYAMLAQGLLELHEAGDDPEGRYLAAARQLLDRADVRFGDPTTGAYFDTPAGQSDLFVRTRGFYDGAIPSGSSAIVHALIDLHRLTGERRFLDRACRALASLSSYIAEAPLGAANSSRALLRLLSIDRGAVQAALAAAEPPTPSVDAAPGPAPVEILAAAESVEIAPDHPASLVLRLNIADGYHVNAADPGESEAAKGLVPLRVHIVNGGGVSVYVDYPPGELFGPEGVGGGQVRVYRGVVDLPVVLERSGDWSGRPLIAVTYQPCTDTACLKPVTVELDVAVDRR